MAAVQIQRTRFRRWSNPLRYKFSARFRRWTQPFAVQIQRTDSARTTGTPIPPPFPARRGMERVALCRQGCWGRCASLRYPAPCRSAWWSSRGVNGSLRRGFHPFGARLRLRSACGFQPRHWHLFHPRGCTALNLASEARNAAGAECVRDR